MSYKTEVIAPEGIQEIFIRRTFDLPIDLLFKAHTEAEFVEQWMGNKVLQLESKRFGAYRFVVHSPTGEVLLQSCGVIHKFIQEECIIRTFEMENTIHPTQLEFLYFKAINNTQSQLEMHVVYESLEAREQILKMPFEYGINMAHDKLQNIF